MSIHHKDDNRKLIFKYKKFPEYNYTRITATDPVTKISVSHLREINESREKSKEDLRYIFFQALYDSKK